MSFKEYIVEKETVRSIGYKQVAEKLYSLEKSLSADSVLAKNISKEFGSDYKKDFAEMSKLLEKIIGIWEEVDYQTANKD